MDSIIFVFLASQLLFDLVVTVFLIKLFMRQREQSHALLTPYHHEASVTQDILSDFSVVRTRAQTLVDQLQHMSHGQTATEHNPQVAQPAQPTQIVSIPAQSHHSHARVERVRQLVQQGASVIEIRKQTGASYEEINLIQSIQ